MSIRALLHIKYRKCKNLQNWLLLAEIFFIELPPLALAYVVDCTSYCKDNHLERHLVELLLGHLQVRAYIPQEVHVRIR